MEFLWDPLVDEVNFLSVMLGRKLNLSSLLRPLILHLYITNRCDARCKMCNIWKEHPKKDLSLDLIELLAKNKTIRNGTMVVCLTGGEPFLRPDLPKIVDVLASNLKRLKEIRLVTNGFRTLKIIKDIKEILGFVDCSINVKVSLDGEADVHNRLRGVPQAFTRAYATIKRLSKLRDSHPNLELTLSLTLTEDNYDQVLPVFSISQNYGALFMCKTALNVYILGTLNEDLDIPEPKLRYISKSVEKVLRSYNRSFPAPLFSKLKFILNKIYLENLILYLKMPKPRFSCYSGFHSVILDSEGYVYPCPVLGKCMGNLKKTSFEEIWHGERARRIREFIKSGKCLCYTYCDLMPTLLWSNFFRVIKELVAS